MPSFPGAFDDKQTEATMHASQWHDHQFLGHDSVRYTLIKSLEEQWFPKKSLLLEASEPLISPEEEMDTPLAWEGRRSCEHIKHLWQEPAASWPELTAREQIPPSLLAQKQLRNHGGSPGEVTLYKGEQQLRRRGRQRKEIRLHIYLGQSVFSTEKTVDQDQAGRAWAYATPGLIHGPRGRVGSNARLPSSKNTQHIPTMARMVSS